MCDWIITHMPWLVAHVGGMSLAGQIALSFGLLAAILLAYRGLQLIVSGGVSLRPRPGKRYHPLFDDDEPFEDWMDAELYEAGEI